jgi:ribosomal protein S7
MNEEVTKTLTIKYEVSRSSQYQSCRVGAEITMQVPVGTDSTATFHNTTKWLAKQCNQAAEEQLSAVLYGEGL